MKKVFICLLILLALIASVSAAPLYVSDGEEIFSSTEEQQLSQMLSDLSNQNGIEIVVVTADSFAGKSAEDYAESCWTYGQFGENGILFLLSMTQRAYYVYTAGSCMSVFDDSALDRMEEAVVSALGAGDAYGAATAFFQTTQSILEGNAAEQASWAWKTPLICFGVGAVIALIVVLVMAVQHKNVHRKAQAGDYVRPGSFHLTQSLDLFLYQTTTRRRKPKNSGSGGGSSGRSHGGRGGSF